MHGIFKLLFGLIAITFGLFTIIKIVENAEIAVGIISLTFGILALIWTSKARSSLSKGSSLRQYTNYFFICLISILLFSVWHMIDKIFLWEETIGTFMAYPGYLLITISYLLFVAASYKILSLGKEFGFEVQAKEIKKAIKKR